MVGLKGLKIYLFSIRPVEKARQNVVFQVLNTVNFTEEAPFCLDNILLQAIYAIGI